MGCPRSVQGGEQFDVGSDTYGLWYVLAKGPGGSTCKKLSFQKIVLYPET